MRVVTCIASNGLDTKALHKSITVIPIPACAADPATRPEELGQLCADILKLKPDAVVIDGPCAGAARAFFEAYDVQVGVVTAEAPDLTFQGFDPRTWERPKKASAKKAATTNDDDPGTGGDGSGDDQPNA